MVQGRSEQTSRGVDACQGTYRFYNSVHVLILNRLFQMVLGLVKSDQSEKPERGFLYVGSHNFTPSAWGRLSKTKDGIKLTIANNELGVLQKLDSHDVSAQADRLVTWKRPALPYRSDDEPWVCNLSYFFLSSRLICSLKFEWAHRSSNRIGVATEVASDRLLSRAQAILFTCAIYFVQISASSSTRYLESQHTYAYSLESR
jgi:hypothetical protein